MAETEAKPMSNVSGLQELLIKKKKKRKKSDYTKFFPTRRTQEEPGSSLERTQGQQLASLLPSQALHLGWEAGVEKDTRQLQASGSGGGRGGHRGKGKAHRGP